MTREEERANASFDYYANTYASIEFLDEVEQDLHQRDIQEAYEQGAVWADQHPDIDVRTMAAWQSGYNEGIAKSRWISVEDGLPPKNEAYLAYWQHLGVTKYRYVKAGAKVSRFFSEHITHWMPLPEAPTVAKNATVKEKGDKK